MMRSGDGMMLERCTDEVLLRAMEAIRDNKEYRSDASGICAALDAYFHKEYGALLDGFENSELRHLMSLWNKFSGEAHYPVPATTEGISGKEEYHSSLDCWNKDTAYGQLRWELLEFCIQRLKDRIYEDKIS